MSQLTVTKQGAEVMADNPSRVDVADYTSGWREFKPAQPREDWRPIVARAAVGVGAFLVLALAYGIWKSLYCWLGGWEVVDTCRGITAAEPVAVALLALATFGVTLWRITSAHQAELRQRQAYRNRTNLVLDRFGNQTPADLFDRMDARALLAYLERRYATDVALKAQTAPHERYWGVNALTEGDHVAPEALPAPEAAPLVPIDSWLPLLNDPNGEPHIMLAGKTNAGKSTMAELILAARVERGDEVFIIDPHYQPINKYGEITWCGLRGVGGASWDAVSQALAQVRAEYDRRKALAEQGQMPQPGGFPPLSVFVDEALETYHEIRRDWEAFQTVMGSGGRKYNIFLVMITQSHLVKDIGGSTATRENFVVIGLGEKARKLIDDEVRDPDEASAMIEALRGEPWAAAMLHNGVVMLLDRSEVRERRPKHLSATLWQPPLVVPTTDPTLAILRSLRRAGWNRDEVRASGLSFSNDLWTAAGE